MVPVTALADENISIVIDGVTQDYNVKVFTKNGRTLAPIIKNLIRKIDD